MKPLLYVGPLSHRVYLATRYSTGPDNRVTVQTKYDVTDQVGAVVAELDRLGLQLSAVKS
jgi:hypothetical protein